MQTLAILTLLIFFGLAAPSTGQAEENICESSILDGQKVLIPAVSLPSASSSRALPSPEASVSIEPLSKKDRDKFALEVMRLVAKQKAKQSDTVVGWLEAINTTVESTRPTVLEYSALLYVFYSGVFDSYPDARVTDLLERSISLSYSKITQSEIPSDGTIPPLPGKVLREAGLKSRLFQEAIYRFSDRKKSISIRGTQKRTLLHKAKALAQNYHVNDMNVATVLVFAASMSTSDGRFAIGGVLLGLAGAAINEYMIHVGIGHAPAELKSAFKKLGISGQFMREITLAHEVHHRIVSQNYGAVLLSEKEIARADKTLRVMVEDLMFERWPLQKGGRKLTNEEIKLEPDFEKIASALVAAIQRGNYGINGTLKGAISMLTTATPFYLLNLAIYAGTGSEMFLVGSMTSLTLFILQSLYSHRYMHIPPARMDEVKTTALQRWYMNTPIGRVQTRRHFVHHKSNHAADKTVNGVIMAFAVADHMLGLVGRGVSEPNVEHLLDLESQSYLEEP